METISIETPASDNSVPEISPVCMDKDFGGMDGLEHFAELDTAYKLGHLADINITGAAHDADNFLQLTRKADVLMKYLSDSRHEIVSNPRVPISAMVQINKKKKNQNLVMLTRRL